MNRTDDKIVVKSTVKDRKIPFLTVASEVTGAEASGRKNRERMEIRKEGCIIGRAVCVPAELCGEVRMRESCLFLQTAGWADMSACSSGDHGPGK